MFRAAQTEAAPDTTVITRPDLGRQLHHKLHVLLDVNTFKGRSHLQRCKLPLLNSGDTCIQRQDQVSPCPSAETNVSADRHILRHSEK